MYIFRLIAQYFEENYFSASLNTSYENLNFTGTVTTLLMLLGGICLGILFASFVIVFEKRVLGRFIRALLSRGACDEGTALSLADLGMENKGFIKRELSRASVSRKLVSVVHEDGTVSSFEDELAAAFPEFAAAASEKAKEAADEGAEAGESHTPNGAAENGLIPEEDRETAAELSARKSAKERAKDFFFEKRFKLRAIDFHTARFFIPEALRFRAEIRFREKGSSPLWLIPAVLLVIALFLLCLRFIPAFVGMLDVSISNIKGN
ncbi:MAG: hypothetical protein E7609_04185 [Ruminococcaceae bacterium]|nr:hypothetical protein [Oscillospiraceae bacterium]